MAVDIYATRTMVGVVENIIPPKTFLRDTFFGRVETSQTEYVDFDKVSPNRKLAPFVRPEMEGKVVQQYGYTTKIYTPPYIKAKMKTDPTDLMNRSAGEIMYTSKTPAQRAAEKLGKDLSTLVDMTVRREEMMCSQILQSGVVTISGDGYNATVTFGMDATHIIAHTGADRWTETTSDPAQDLSDWVDLIEKDSGVVPDMVIMGVNAAKDFLAHASVTGKLDNRRIVMGEIAPRSLGPGVKYLGEWEGLDIYQYTEWYSDDNGTLQRVWPTDGVLVGSTQAANAIHYGAIKDMDFVTGESRMFQGRYFPKSWLVPDPSGRWLMLQSAPLPALYYPEAFVFADVEAAA